MVGGRCADCHWTGDVSCMSDPEMRVSDWDGICCIGRLAHQPEQKMLIFYIISIYEKKPFFLKEWLLSFAWN